MPRAKATTLQPSQGQEVIAINNNTIDGMNDQTTNTSWNFDLLEYFSNLFF